MNLATSLDQIKGVGPRPAAARHIVGSILQRMDILRDFPLAGPGLGGVSDSLADYRLLVVGNYQIIYRVSKAEVVVARIIYATTDYTRLF